MRLDSHPSFGFLPVAVISYPPSRICRSRDTNMQRPRGVTILATLVIVLACLNLLTGVLVITGAIPFEKATGSLPDLGDMQASFEQTVKVLMVLFSVAGFAVGVGLLLMKNWARAITRVLCVLGLLGALIQMIQAFTVKDAPSFLFYALAGGAYYWAFFYLGRKHLRDAFAPPPPAGSPPPPPDSPGPGSAG